MNSNRKTAIITGVLFIIATAASLASTSFTGSILSAPDYLIGISAHRNPIMLGGLFQFIAAATSAGIAISLYPILKKHKEGLALGAVGFRLVEAVFYIVDAVGLLSLFTLSQEFVKAGAPSASYFQTLGTLISAIREWAGFGFAVLAFSVAALMYYYIFYQSKLIPQWLAAWGLIGAVLILAIPFSIMFGEKPFSVSGINVLFVLPIFLQEMVLAVWLILKGFNPSAIASTPGKADAI